MPTVLAHSLRLRRMIRRWRIVGLGQGEGNIGEFTSWVQPVVRLDRDWADDDRLWFGYTADITTADQTEFGAVAIFSGSREVHVHQIEFRITTGIGFAVINAEVNLLKPPSAYNPVVFGAGEFFPFLQTGRNNTTLQLPEARVIAGFQSGLMVVTIGGVPVNPAIGPRYTNTVRVVDGLGTRQVFMTQILKRSDPPLILPPFNVLAVQTINPNTVSPQILFVNLYLSERET